MDLINLKSKKCLTKNQRRKIKYSILDSFNAHYLKDSKYLIRFEFQNKSPKITCFWKDATSLTLLGGRAWATLLTISHETFKKGEFYKAVS